MGDRDGKWSTSTVFMAMFMGFAIGFLTCHQMYAGGLKNQDLHELR